MSSQIVLRSLHIWRDLTRKFSPKHWPNIIYLEFNSWYDKTPSKDDAAIIFKKISIVASTLDTDDERTMVTGPRRLVEIQKIIQKNIMECTKASTRMIPIQIRKTKQINILKKWHSTVIHWMHRLLSKIDAYSTRNQRKGHWPPAFPRKFNAQSTNV